MGKIMHQGINYSIVNEESLSNMRDTEITNPADGNILQYDATDNKWKNGTAQEHTSFNGRSGSILPMAGDYDATQVNYDNNTSVKQKIDGLVTGVSSFNNRSGSILPTAGDYSAEDITYGQSTVKDALDNIGNSVVSSFNGRNGAVIPTTGDYTADKVIFSSIMSIGGQTQSNVEDGVNALNDTKVECVTIATEQEWEQMTEAEKNDPSKLYFLPWDTSGSGGGSSSVTADQVILSSVAHIGAGTQETVQDVIDTIAIIHPHYEIVTWADGTDEEIINMLNAHYRGEINIYDYWGVGDERVVHLNAMTATGVNESHVAQDITMVLMNKGGKNLSIPVYGNNTCTFIVGQKNCLNEIGYMNSSSSNTWATSARRTWCNNVYKNALPSTLVEIFKEYQNSAYPSISKDYFAFPSEKEVFGTINNSNSDSFKNDIQFEYYETSANRIKKERDTGNNMSWWTRAAYTSSGYTKYCYVLSNGSVSTAEYNADLGLAPFGVI